MRKILILLLFFAGWALIFSPFWSTDSILTYAFFSKAHPSNRPLPNAWQASEHFRVSDPSLATGSGLPVTSEASNEPCASWYSLAPGDTLGEIARSCGVSLGELLSANPQIQNPNRVYAGQQVVIPDPIAGRGGADLPSVDSSQAQTSGFQPGATVLIDLTNLPPNRTARIGLGLSGSGYHALAERSTDANGNLRLAIPFPTDVQPGESAFIMVTIPGMPTIQRMSESFVIGAP